MDMAKVFTINSMQCLNTVNSLEHPALESIPAWLRDPAITQDIVVHSDYYTVTLELASEA